MVLIIIALLALRIVALLTLIIAALLASSIMAISKSIITVYTVDIKMVVGGPKIIVFSKIMIDIPTFPARTRRLQGRAVGQVVLVSNSSSDRKIGHELNKDAVIHD